MSGRFVVEADGGSRGNPGPAGYGALVRDAASGRVLAERAASVGRATNNVAEYGGLVAGLQAVLDLTGAAAGAAEVEVRMDSKLVVEQMSGRWKVKHPDMQTLARQAQQIARQLGRVRYTWVPRAQNSAADALANSAMDGKPIHRGGAAEPSTTEDDVQPVLPAAEPAPVITTVTHLLRHGQTEHTPERRFSGRNDLPLSAVGRAEAEGAAERAAALGIEVIAASPLRRTRETAEIVAARLGLEVQFDDDLVELDFGELEGLSADEARERHPLATRRMFSEIDVPAPGGESVVDVSRRVDRARARILRAHRGSTVLVVSHVTPIKLLLAAGLDVPDTVVHRIFLSAASLSTVAWSTDGRASVRLVNDTAHLPG